MGDVSAEPSMEEILSSIKRIIAEEGEVPARQRRQPRPVPAPAVEDDSPEVLELSDPMPLRMKVEAGDQIDVQTLGTGYSPRMR